MENKNEAPKYTSVWEKQPKNKEDGNKKISKILIIVSFIFGGLALLIAATPFRIIAVLPAVIGLIFAAVVYLKTKKEDTKNKNVMIAGGLSAFVLVFVIFWKIAFPPQINADDNFNAAVIDSSSAKATETIEDMMTEDNLAADDIFGDEIKDKVPTTDTADTAKIVNTDTTKKDSTVTEETFEEEEIFEEESVFDDDM